MGETPSDADKDLLQRLNALKPSTVQLEFGNASWGDSPEHSDDENEIYADKAYLLAAQPSQLDNNKSGGHYRYLYSVPEETEQEEEEDVEELLATLRSRETWKLEHELQTEGEIKSLVDEAKKFVLYCQSSFGSPLQSDWG
ncbi:predicted protein [Uncinocarpus reesii 1704]|uniref:Uncharacterized protein n=1 Tax=Uncinocarpus reesii (strain UAMH 1704) TaxID=336963 RepID=C4JIE1_UNCRE|nr:uncharacterized protein UREG_01478 [Uncinocarpus reesii 1704]EEP76629.1 predicted protein [Uncinocarpus reesii 1704]